MEIVLTHGADHEGQVVRFTSAGAHGWGTWRGSGAGPGGVPVDVELDVGAASWADVLAAGADAPPDGSAVLVGTVEAVEADGAVALRVGTGVVLVELTGVAPADPRGRTVRLRVGGVGLFPTGV